MKCNYVKLKYKQGLGTALDLHANGTLLNEIRRTENLSEEKEAMVERLGEMRKRRRERIKKESKERIEREKKEAKEKETKGS